MIDHETPNIFHQMPVFPLVPYITFTWFKIPKKYLWLGSSILVTSFKIDVCF